MIPLLCLVFLRYLSLFVYAVGNFRLVSGFGLGGTIEFKKGKYQGQSCSDLGVQSRVEIWYSEFWGNN